MKNIITYVNDYKFDIEGDEDTFVFNLHSVCFDCRKTLTKPEIMSVLKFLSNQDDGDADIEFLNPDTSDAGTLSPETNMLIKRVSFKGKPLYIFIFYKELMIGNFFKEITLYEFNVNEIYNRVVRHIL